MMANPLILDTAVKLLLFFVVIAVNVLLAAATYPVTTAPSGTPTPEIPFPTTGAFVGANARIVGLPVVVPPVKVLTVCAPAAVVVRTLVLM